MRVFCFFLCLLLSPSLFAQTETPPPTVRVVDIAQLEQAFRTGGDTLTVFNFWATWCRPCVAELPAFQQLHQESAGKPLRVVLVSLDFKSELEKTLIPFLQKKGIALPVWLLDGKPALYIDRVSRSWSGSIPASLFVRPSHKIYRFEERDFTFDELNELVEGLLK